MDYVVLLLLLPRLPAVGVLFLCPDREQAWRGRIRQAGRQAMQYQPNPALRWEDASGEADAPAQTRR